MCKFFTFSTDGCDSRYYFDWPLRQSTKRGPVNSGPDSYASIAKQFKLPEDKLNKYEYNPLTKIFTVNQINCSVDDRLQAEDWVKSLDFKTIVESLIIKNIIDPFQTKTIPLSQEHKGRLRECASTRNSTEVSNSVSECVRLWVGGSVRISVWDSVRDLVGGWVRDLVCNSVRAIDTRVMDSVLWAYAGSFFSIKYASFRDIKYPIDISPWVKLWEDGYVPSFDGTTWRLHAGETAKIVYERKGW